MSEDDASVGTLVRVPKRGVYEVVSLGEVFGQRFYALARCGGPEQDRLRLPDFVGCERVEEASGGSLITAEHAERILSSLGRLEPIHPDNWIRRNEAYREILRNLDPDEMARLMQDLSRNEKAAPRDVERARAFLLEHCSRALGADASAIAARIDAALAGGAAS